MDIIYKRGTKHINANAFSIIGQCEQCVLEYDPRKKRHVKVYEDDMSIASAETKVTCSLFLNNNNQIKDSTLEAVMKVIGKYSTVYKRGQ